MTYYHIDLDIGITAQQIREQVIKNALPHADEAEGITLTIDGFGADSRELWQIAEVCDFMRMLVGEGILSVLKMPNLREDGAFIVNDPMGFGALEVFLMARNLNLSGMTISSDLMTEFFAAVNQANNQIVERYGSRNGFQCEE